MDKTMLKAHLNNEMLVDNKCLPSLTEYIIRLNGHKESIKSCDLLCSRHHLQMVF